MTAAPHFQRTVILPQQLRAILRNRPIANNSLTKLYICSLLLLNACDAETNPGPGADHSTVYPCGACDMPVTWAQQAVACETCSLWYHIDCQGISSHTNDALHSSAVVWNCHSCGVTNYTATLFDLTSLVTSNSFSSLPRRQFYPQHRWKPRTTSGSLVTNTQTEAQTQQSEETTSSRQRQLPLNKEQACRGAEPDTLDPS